MLNETRIVQKNAPIYLGDMIRDRRSTKETASFFTVLTGLDYQKSTKPESPELKKAHLKGAIDELTLICGELQKDISETENTLNNFNSQQINALIKDIEKSLTEQRQMVQEIEHNRQHELAVLDSMVREKNRILDMAKFKLLKNNYQSDINRLDFIKQSHYYTGFKRCAANSINFSALATSPEEYIEKVRYIFAGYLKNTYIDYTYLGYLSKWIIDAILSAISILEKGNFMNAREFITAAVVTGYVYNGMPEGIAQMRPIDDYDVMRFYLMFLTMKKHNIGMDSISSVRKHSIDYIKFGNVDIYLPSVNECSLSIEGAMIQLKQTPLLSG